MDTLRRRTVVAGAGAMAALTAVAPSLALARPPTLPSEREPDETTEHSNVNQEPGQYWVWFGGHWDAAD